MTNNDYGFKELDSKTLRARMVDSQAVRVIEKVKEKIGRIFGKFVKSINKVITDAGNVITEAKNEAIASDINRMSAKIEENKKIMNEIQSKETTPSSNDFSILSRVQAENEKLTGKIGDLSYKKVEPKVATSTDLGALIDKELSNNNVEVNENKIDDINKIIDAAGITNINAEQAKVVEAVAPQKIVETPKPASVEAKKETNDNLSIADQVLKVIETADKLKARSIELTEANHKLVIDNNAKDAKISDLEAQVKAVSAERDGLKNENKTLTETNSNQVATIARMSKEQDTLRSSIKDQKALEDQIHTFEETIKKHDLERQDMLQEFESLKFSANDNKNSLEKLQKDYDAVTKERDTLSYQMEIIKQRLGYTTSIAPSAVEESKTR